jgi:membrane-associated phospholipid phosphatase
MVYLFTVLIPTMLIRLYRRYQGWSLLHLLARERRVIPYVISILCYFTCYNILTHHNVPHIITSILVAALVVQILCALVNVWWKISTHTAAIGGVTGGVIAFAFIFNFNPIWWLTLVILLGGLVGSSRMMLRQHTLAQVVCGFLLGMLAVIVTVLT